MAKKYPPRTEPRDPREVYANAAAALTLLDEEGLAVAEPDSRNADNGESAADGPVATDDD